MEKTPTSSMAPYLFFMPRISLQTCCFFLDKKEASQKSLQTCSFVLEPKTQAEKVNVFFMAASVVSDGLPQSVNGCR